MTKHGQPLFVALPFAEDLLQYGVRKALAMSLLRSKYFSIVKTAEISGVPYVDFLPYVKALGMYVVDGDPAELTQYKPPYDFVIFHSEVIVLIDLKIQ